MSVTIESFIKRGYTPLACNRYAGIAWQGERLQDFWMWNGQVTEYEGGVRRIQTVKLDDLKEAALRYWRDRWVPLKPVDEELLRRMEGALRVHAGLKSEGVSFPDGEFLRRSQPVPEELMGPEVRAYMGLEGGTEERLERVANILPRVLDTFRQTKRRLQAASNREAR